ncbi:MULTISPECIES: DUF4240 domain-containing protein [unclassified Streptomyces]|uniref:DUF4240 domain-containing protein n=1 Tax=unclassified Streptomyces TaxID=2593676 RepID=UPI000DAE121C|nr:MULTISPECIES: DUF4240 domain-containing protein [unclassified Streptomyces]PZT75381.1 hypothetical protein DNK55_22960 [Streptomyces sp. AC1-42T]PZT83845.1 hypothetical protein DNK56_08485 [Streptomyces sp. AC1-42W]
MTWADFWALIATLNGEATEANCRRLAKRLSRRPLPEITAFAERHAEALYRLDQEKFGTLPVADMTLDDGAPFPQSGDSFLYARCAVVAAGRHTWESVFSDPAKFAPYTATTYDGERLLYVPDEAYELATAEEWPRTTRYCYESFSNKDGWPALPHHANRGGESESP